MHGFPVRRKRKARLAARQQARSSPARVQLCYTSLNAPLQDPSPAMNPTFDLVPFATLPRQQSLLGALVPVLAELDAIDAILLSGSLARQDADDWSSVDICLIWKTGEQGATTLERCDELRDALDRAVGREGYQLGLATRKEGVDSLLGITLAGGSDFGREGQGVASGVIFRFCWEASISESDLWVRSGPVRPIYLSQRLSPEVRAPLKRCAYHYGTPDSHLIGAQLGQFWLLLAQLPTILERREDLAAHTLLGETRSLLLDLVVALNGATRPTSTARVNRFLGPDQQQAFEKSLGLGRISSGATSPKSNWIGQAVAMIVLYRWYAPQLCEIFCAPYPQQAEDTVLDLMRSRLEGWPAVIETG